jgi:8-oxo-dGTP pyrophosphatase MutT (NUDIX family)
MTAQQKHSSPKVIVHRCVAAIVCYQSRVLLCHRRSDRSWYPDCWDLPGGHQQPDETPKAALKRELAEELGISVVSPLGPEFEQLRSGDTALRVWILDRWDGTITNASPSEHDRLGWFAPQDLPKVHLASVQYLSLLNRALGLAEGP